MVEDCLRTQKQELSCIDCDCVRMPVQLFDEKIALAARKRLNYALRQFPEADLIISIENGLCTKEKADVAAASIYVRNFGVLDGASTPIGWTDTTWDEWMEERKHNPDMTGREYINSKHHHEWELKFSRRSVESQLRSAVLPLVKQAIILRSLTLISDYPQKGVIFQDFHSLLHRKEILAFVCDAMQEKLALAGSFTHIAGVDSRGCWLGFYLAMRCNVGFIPIRKRGKLPPPVLGLAYETEYSSDYIEVQESVFDSADMRVVVVDDIVATGGSLRAVCDLIEGRGKIVAALTLLDVPALRAAYTKKMDGTPVIVTIKPEPVIIRV